jgi:hypothetical protein
LRAIGVPADLDIVCTATCQAQPSKLVAPGDVTEEGAKTPHQTAAGL